MDAQNHGMSDKACESMDYASIASDVMDTLNDMHVRRVHLVEYSIEGNTASMAAPLYSNRVAPVEYYELFSSLYIQC